MQKFLKHIYTSKIVIFVFLLSIHIIIGMGIIQNLSPTYDEPVHLYAGSIYLKTGNYIIGSLTYLPPLTGMIAAAPLLLIEDRVNFLDYPVHTANQLWHFSDLFLYHNESIDPEKILTIGRLSVFIFFSFILALGIYWWAREMYGPGAAWISLFLYSFSPSILAHSTLVTPDFGVTALFFLSVIFFIQFLKKPTIISAIIAGTFQGMAFAAKLSSIILPIIFLIYIIVSYRKGIRELKKCILLLLILGGVTLIVFSSVYRFNSIHYFYKGVQTIIQHNANGHNSFLIGEYSNKGWWYYFFVTFVLKTPISLLLFVGVYIYMNFKRYRVLAWTEKKYFIFLIVPVCTVFCIASMSNIQIGHRYILPIYPFLFVMGGGGCVYFISNRKGLVFSVLMLVWYLIVSLRAYPFSISYFNELVRGSDGYHYLVDSNNDWGQGLKALADYLNDEGVNSIFLSYFGNGDPDYYGIKYIPVHFVSAIKRYGHKVDPMKEKKILFVVSATNYQGVYLKNRAELYWLKKYCPEKVIAGSLLVFDITENGEALHYFKTRNSQL